LALSPNIRGSLLMAVSMAAFTTNDSITKVVSSEMNFGQVMLVRGLFAILLVAAFAWHQGALRPLRTLMEKPVALRVFGEIGGTISFMAALAHLPLANTSAIFQALPLAITLGAAVIFGEPVGWRRWSAIVAGFIGVLIIVRPGLVGFSQYSLFALVSVAFCALRDLATRRIPAKIPSLFITLLTTVTVTTAGGAILVPLGGWTPPSTGALGLQAVAAVLLLIGYQCIISALRSGDISAVAPFRYSALLWAMLLGYLVFGDRPDAMMVTGAAIIVLSGLYAFYRERVRERPVAATTSGIPPDGL
jgi:drug/metabolite transporter (DMT)-like permease